jgi:hypothetical protein
MFVAMKRKPKLNFGVVCVIGNWLNLKLIIVENDPFSEVDMDVTPSIKIGCHLTRQ